jgi:DNA-binding SARP family transcriptional activator/TolB-like protein
VTRQSTGSAATVQLQLLGGSSLRTGDAELSAVLAQPRRFALLAYLALRGSRTFVRRDELVGMFWPESTEDRARAALRQALRFLRTGLGANAILNRGQDEVGLGPESIACDAADFLAHLGRGSDEAAVAHYTGDLLPGFHIEDAHDFDRWLQGERQRLRSLALEAALRLADRDEDEGNAAGAAERVRWALRLEPTNEAVARRLISLLARAGDAAAAIFVYEQIEQRLAEELSLDISQETADVIAAVRAGSVGAAGPAGRPGGAPSPQRVLVLELTNLTGDDQLHAIGRLAADAVAQGLAGVPGLEVIPPLAVSGARARAGDPLQPTVDSSAAGIPAELTDIVRRTGAGTLLTGTVHRIGDDLRLDVRITDVAHGRLLEGPEPIVVPRSAVLDGVERLREEVMISLGRALTQRAIHVRDASRPPGMEAFRAYLDGLEHFIRGEWRTALANYRRSSELEPEYALPRIVSAIALWNLGELPDAQAAAAEASRLGHSLGRFERAVLDMVLAWLAGDWAAARRAAAVQAEIAPGSIPNFQVAEEARRLNRPREAREVLARLDPEEGELRGWIFYWIELAAAHHLLGDHPRELELASRCRRLHPDEPAAALLEIRALAALGREADVLRITDQALSSPASQRQQTASLLIEAALELRAHGCATPPAHCSSTRSHGSRR